MRRRNFLGSLAGGISALTFQLSKMSGNNKFIRVNAEKQTDVLVKVLGTAQDGGLPQPGCYCKNCLRARNIPQYSRLISSLGILDFKERQFFLLDATPDIRIQIDTALKRLGKTTRGRNNLPQGLLLTHAHIGHYTGLVFFGFEAASSSSLPVYVSGKMGGFLRNNGPWSQLVRLKNISLHILPFDQQVNITPNLSCTAFPVAHRDEYSDTLGFVISGRKKSLLYIPDIQSWKAWNRDIAEEVKKVHIAILDGTFFSPEELPGRDLSLIGHPLIQSSLKTLGKVARDGKTKILFTHLNHSNPALDPEGEERKIIENEGFKVAEDGMEFYL